MTAYDLARLRALAAAPVADLVALTQSATEIGREPVRAGKDFVLARHAEAPTPADLDIHASSLPNSALIALGLCIGLAWADRERHPYPGRTMSISDVTTAARAMRIELSAIRHIVGAIRHVLAEARVLDVDGDLIRLGPVVAGWSDSDLDAFRRNIDVLPEALRDPS